jgi:hypothetical protein
MSRPTTITPGALLGLSLGGVLADHTRAYGLLQPDAAGQPNTVQLVVTHGQTPVVDLVAGDLAVEIGYGGQTIAVDSRRRSTRASPA